MRGKAGASVIRVSVCCNDGNNGVCLGVFEAIDFVDSRDYSARLYGPPTRVTYLEGRARISRRLYEISSFRYGVGNWCWDGFAMSRGSALRLLEYLLKARRFEVEEYDHGGPFAGLIERRCR